MKKILYILFIGLFLNACNVDVENPNAIQKTDFWKTEQDARYGINAVYNMFYKPGTYTRWIWFRLDLTSDEGFSQSPWAELKEWTRFQYFNYDFVEGNSDTYNTCYRAIFRANQVLQYVPNIPFNNEDEKKGILAQAYFLRGLHYYNLALLWGSENRSLPIVTEPSTPEMAPEGHTETEVYQQAIRDFSEAIKLNLPELWNDANKGRPTKGAALAFRAKCYMQLRQWNEAKSDLNWLVEGEGKKYYDLMSDYSQNFTKTNENNIESVFEIQYSDIHTAPAGDGDFDADPNLGQNRGQFFAPPSIGWYDGELRQWIVDEFKKEKNIHNGYDIRLKQTAFYSNMAVDFENNNRIYGLTSNEDLWRNWDNRVFIRKYSSENFRDFEDYHNPINIRLIRFSDVLLMYAECIAETDGSLSVAVKYVDRVRNRVDLPNLSVNHATATSSKAAFLKRLQMERSLELATEGHRWADIKRWGLLDTQEGIEELKSRDSDFGNFVIGKHARLPIPSSEKNNNPNIEQNPKY